MIQLICKCCGGNLKLNPGRTLGRCEYCDSEYIIENRKDATMNIIKAVTPEPENEKGRTKCAEYYTEEGRLLKINYLYLSQNNYRSMYVTENNVIFVYPREKAYMADSYINHVCRIKYPDEEMKRKSHYYLPCFENKYKLMSGAVMVVIKKLKWTYPISLAGKPGDIHAAWIISRLEHLACLFEYNEMSPSHIDMNDIFFDPRNHQVMVYGGWEHVENKAINFLRYIRCIGTHLMNDKDTVRPALEAFLTSSPKSDAIEDFGYWDKTIDKAFGKRSFAVWNVTEKEIYERMV